MISIVLIHSNTFFQTFRSNNPTMPFLCDKLEEIIRRLMLMIIVKILLIKHLAKINLDYLLSQLPDTSVKLPIATSSAIRQVDGTDIRKQQFKREYKQILISMLKKFLERSPIQYKICRASSAIAPGNMINKNARSITYFAVVCDQLFMIKI